MKYVGLARSTYYYKQQFGLHGIKCSTTTLTRDNTEVSNSIVVEKINKIFQEEEFACYGYIATWHVIKTDFLINRKKVYRLMKENNLLLTRIKRCNTNKNYVKFRKIKNATLFSNLEMDIKYIPVKGENRNAYLLSVIDVCTRVNLGHLLAYSMKSDRVKKLFEYILKAYNINPKSTSVSLRTDNGSQFIAKNARDYMSETGINHEFTHIATPEENAHIESFHSIIDREFVKRFDLDNLTHARSMMLKYMEWYNFRRVHSSIRYKTPMQLLKELIKM